MLETAEKPFVSILVIVMFLPELSAVRLMSRESCIKRFSMNNARFIGD